ncbi:MAG: acyl-CoA synthetase [Acidimicrobiia bacterium]|nr:acyl-CoA synthetase [Acidimicrobiia bacterium]
MFYSISVEFNLADLFEVVADTVPERLALIAGDARCTYRGLDERANRVAHHLIDAGITPGDHVALYSWNRAEWLEAELGIYKARAAVINVNYRYVADELRYMLENSDAVAVIFERAFAPLVAKVRTDCPRLRHFVVIEDGTPVDGPAGEAATRAVAELGAVAYEDALAAASPARDFAPRSPDDLYVLYTGGTTGMPKGVLWRQEDIFFAALGGGGFGMAPIATPEELAERVSADDSTSVGVINAPMMHGGGQWTTFINFFGGNTVVLNCDRHFSGDRVLRMAEAEGAHSIMVVGDAMARPITDALADPTQHYELPNLVIIGSGGAIMSKSVKEELRRLLPGAFIADSFGASETGAAGTVMDSDGPAAGPKFTIGEFVNVLGDDRRPVAPGSGEVGLLARRGHIPLGYFKDEAKTAATFLVDPDGVRWVVPGDYATIEADGTLNLLGRGSACINTGGEKVYVEEVESVLKAHPQVFDAVVVGVPDERFVERVAAIVTPRDGTAPTLEMLADFCSTHLARYKVPRQLHLTDDIPRTPVGKPDYRWAKRVATESESETPSLTSARSVTPNESE